MNAKTKMQHARIGLLLDEPFFGALLLGLTSIEDKAGQHTKTMATDGVSLYWHTGQIEKWSEAEIKTVLAHEALHCALLHPLRRGNRQPSDWNVACDHAVNLVLEQCNEDAIAKGRPAPFAWPHDCQPLKDAQHKGKSAEEIYSDAQQSNQGDQTDPNGQPGQGQGNGQPQLGDGMGDVLDAPAPDQSSKDSLEATWKQQAVQAAQAAKGRGNVPSEMAKLIDELLNPKVSWQEILRRFVRDNAKDDYSFARPNTRYAATGFILPSLHSQKLGTIAIVRDTSGSTQDWQAEILAELAGIISEAQPSKIIVIDADASVQRVLELDPSDPLPTDAIGGGGTDFVPALEALEQFDPLCAVYLTDLDGRFPDAAPNFPVLWATNSEQQAPFGETIKV